VDQDEEAMMQYLDGNDPSIELLMKCIRTGTNAAKFVPVLAGSAFKNKGVQVIALEYI
jgi:elongation factor G